jgi:hypothetical protein
MRSDKLTIPEKLETIYLSPYYLQAFFFLVGTLSWLMAETVFPARLPFWTVLWGWSLVLTNMISLPLMNAAGMFLEESEERDYLGLASFIALSYILVPFQAYAAFKGFLEKEEGPWFRTPKTGKITDVLKRGTFYRFIAGIMPGRPATEAAEAKLSGLITGQPAFMNKYMALATANNRFDSFRIRPRRMRWVGKVALAVLLAFTTTIYHMTYKVSEVVATPALETLWLHGDASAVLTGTLSNQLKTSAGDVVCNVGQGPKHAKLSGFIQARPDILNNNDVVTPCPADATGTGWIYDTPFDADGSLDGDFHFYTWIEDNVANNIGYVMACVYKVDIVANSISTSTLLVSSDQTGGTDIWSNSDKTIDWTETDPCGEGCAIGNDAEKYLYVDYYLSSGNQGNKANAALKFGEEMCGAGEAAYPQIQITLFNIPEKLAYLAILAPFIPFLAHFWIKKRKKRLVAYA